MALSQIRLTGEKQKKQLAREEVARQSYNPRLKINRFHSLIALMPEIPLSQIDRKVKHRENLSFEEAFVGMCYIIAATNRCFLSTINSEFKMGLSETRALAMGVAFAQLMATKESLAQLTAEEIAGFAAAAMIDIVTEVDFGQAVIEMGGMGGDRGFVVDGVRKKTINLSTLSSFVLAGAKLPVVKHGSYSNTSAVGSTEAIEFFGAQTNQETSSELVEVFKNSGFCFIDAHWCKTVHDLSHLLMMETINHVVGPMTAPINYSLPLTKIMGVNEKVYPGSVAQAYTILHNRRIVNLHAACIVTGLDRVVDPMDREAVREAAILDELSPVCSVVSAAIGSGFIGTCLVKPEDFGIEIDPGAIVQSNTAEAIHLSNIQALKGQNKQLADYLAMNAALAYFTHVYRRLPDTTSRHLLKECFVVCREAISNGSVWRTMSHYVEATNGTLAV